MKITKYGHACVFLEDDGHKLIIDPGELTELPAELSNVSAVIVTHPHPDHLDRANLQKIIDRNPDSKIYGVSETIDGCQGLSAELVRVDADTGFAIGDFRVDLYHVDHAVIYQSSPCKNLAIMVNDEFYYPGDSFHTVDKKVRVLAVPVSAPWLKLGEAVDFMLKMSPEVAFPTHNGLYNEVGDQIVDTYLGKVAQAANIEFTNLKPGDTL